MIVYVYLSGVEMKRIEARCLGYLTSIPHSALNLLD
jgi:hypothetical protein